MKDRALAVEAGFSWGKLGRIKQFLSRRCGWKWRTWCPRGRSFLVHQHYYLFWCRTCQRPAKDYPRRAAEGNYFICPDCGERQIF